MRHQNRRRAGRQRARAQISNADTFHLSRLGAAMAACIWYAAINACKRSRVKFDPIPRITMERGLSPSVLMESVTELFSVVRADIPGLEHLGRMAIEHVLIMWRMAAGHHFDQTDHFEALKIFLGKITSVEDLEAIAREVPDERPN